MFTYEITQNDRFPEKKEFQNQHGERNKAKGS
jgi:hypothetical protein